MNKHVFLLCLTAIAIISSTAFPAFADDKDGDTDEVLVLNLADNWKLANKRHAGNEYVLQYLPAGSNPTNPAELITVTTTAGVPQERDAKTYILQVKQAMESAKGSAFLAWRIIKESPTDASCEYTLVGHGKIPDQHEFMRVIRGAEEIHTIIFHFGKKSLSDPEKERAWAIVNAVKLTPVNEK